MLWGLRLNIGDAIIGGAVLLWALYSVLLRRRPVVHPLSFLAASMVVGIAVIAPFYAHELWSGRLIVPASGSALAIAYVAIFRSEEHTSELQSLMRISYAVFCLKKK